MPSRSIFAGLITVTTALAGPSRAQPCSPEEIAKLLAADGAAGNQFGRSVSVSVSGDTAVIGAHMDDDNGSDSGSASVFRFDGTDWAEEAKLLPADGAVGDSFGWSVSLSDDTAVIGAQRDNDNGILSGSAYVFRFDGTGWVQEAKLLASDGAANDEFGISVSVSDNVAVVGTRYSDAAYVFRFNGTDWVQEAKLLAADGAGNQFGESVSVSGDTAVVGAPYDFENGYFAGSAYIFRHGDAGWVQEAKLLPTDGAAGDWFGGLGSVSVSGSAAVIGARGGSDNGDNSGSAYVFRFDGANWVQEAKLLATDGAVGDFFGLSVSLSGDTAVIGAHLDDDNGAESGSAYVYRFDGTNWTQEAKLLAGDGAQGDEFGYSVSVSGDTAAIGAFFDDDNGSQSGSAYIFDLNCMTVCLPDVNGDGMLTPTDFTAWINAFNNNLPECDQNNDGSCTPTDFTAWIANFNAGC